MSDEGPSTTGTIPFVVPAADKSCSTWYKLFGSLDSISPTAPPLIVLHGGPGGIHQYLIPVADLYKTHGIPVIFYDQIGNGNSTHLREKMGDTTFWTEALFMDELENLLAHFGLGGSDGKSYDLFGQSWGGMIGSRFAASGRPRTVGLRRLVLADAPSSVDKWLATAKKQIATLPQDVQEALRKHEEAGTVDSDEYKQAVGLFYKTFTIRIDPMPEQVIKAFAEIEKDPTVYHTMNGPNEFIVVGPMKAWNVEADIPKIKAATLIVNGRWDTASDDAVAAFFYNISSPVKWVKFYESSHMPHWEERERYMEVVGGFLRA